jgi:acetylornithine deacetylase/succinyl-diaminopimelate desuccinylase-like protein
LPLAAARRLIERFSDLVAALAPSRDDRFDPPQAVTNLGFIEGRDGVLEMLLDARLLPGHRPEALATVFEEEVRAVGGSVVFERANPAVYTDPDGALSQAAIRTSQRLALDPSLHTKATNTEAAAFAGRAEAIVFGPGPSVGNAHCPNEHTLVPQLAQAIDWYEALIRELCC